MGEHYVYISDCIQKLRFGLETLDKQRHIDKLSESEKAMAAHRPLALAVEADTLATKLTKGAPTP